MSAGWATIALLAAGTAAIRVSGPVLLGDRKLPPGLVTAIAALAPALLAALVLTGTLADGRSLVIDERVLGVSAGGAALLARAPVIVAIVLAAAVTAAARALD